MVQNKAFVYKKVPNGWPVPGQDLTIEDVGFDEAADPPKNGFTTKNLYATFDPSQRGRMRAPSNWSYSPALEIGKPVDSVQVIGKILKSANSGYHAGMFVLLWISATQCYSVVPESALKMVEVIDPEPGIPLTAYVGVLGMTGTFSCPVLIRYPR